MIDIKNINRLVISYLIVSLISPIALAESPLSEGWELVAKTASGNEDWLNVKGILVLNNGDRRAEIIKNLGQPYDGARSIKMVSVFHCKEWRVTHGEWVFWSEKWGRGAILWQVLSTSQEKSVEPGSIGAAILDAVCRSMDM